MRTFSSLRHRLVETESGEKLGRLYDLRGELTESRLKVTALVIGRRGFLEHLGLPGLRAAAKVRGHDTIPWDAVVAIEGDRIVVKDGTKPR